MRGVVPVLCSLPTLFLVCTAIGTVGAATPAGVEAQYKTCSRMLEDPISPFAPEVPRACEAVLEVGYRPAEAYFYLGRYWFLASQWDKGIRYLERAHELGNVKATTALGYAYAHAGRYPLDSPQVIEYYQQGVAKGDPRAMLLMSEIYVLRTTPDRQKRLERTRKYLELVKRAAEAGDPLGYYYLAQFFAADGDEIPADKQKAIHYYRLAAEAGVQEAINALEYLGQDVSAYEELEIVYEYAASRIIAFHRP